MGVTCYALYYPEDGKSTFLGTIERGWAGTWKYFPKAIGCNPNECSSLDEGIDKLVQVQILSLIHI